VAASSSMGRIVGTVLVDTHRGHQEESCVICRCPGVYRRFHEIRLVAGSDGESSLIYL